VTRRSDKRKCRTCGGPWDGHAVAPGGGPQCNRCAADERIRSANTRIYRLLDAINGPCNLGDPSRTIRGHVQLLLEGLEHGRVVTRDDLVELRELIDDALAGNPRNHKVVDEESRKVR
jgi:hypothetical protein